jgi:hypothetical protein
MLFVCCVCEIEYDEANPVGAPNGLVCKACNTAMKNTNDRLLDLSMLANWDDPNPSPGAQAARDDYRNALDRMSILEQKAGY